MVDATSLTGPEIEKIVADGTAIYEEVKAQYEPQYHGQFLAIDIGSKKVYLSDTSAMAVQLAKKDYPDNIFYVKKIGFGAAETIAQLFSEN
jgi:hypothetical protein